MSLIKDVYGFDANIGSLIETSNQFLKVKNKLGNILVNEDTFVGLEVEVEQVARQTGICVLDGVTVWKNTLDGSLRNNGREFVSIPLRGKEILFALDKLYALLRRDPNCVGHEFNYRTGLHVHMNVRDMDEQKVLDLILLYTVMEDFFYSFAGQERKENIYCVPINCSDKFTDFMGLLESPHPTRHLREGWTKYMGLNILPINRYGTLEFRHLRGTNDPEHIIKWLNLIFSLKNYVLKTTRKDLLDTITKLNTTSEYLGFVTDVFGDLLRDIPDFAIEQSLENTTSRIKNIFTSCNQSISRFFSEDYIEKSRKEPVVNNFLNYLTQHRYVGIMETPKPLSLEQILEGDF